MLLLEHIIYVHCYEGNDWSVVFVYLSSRLYSSIYLSTHASMYLFMYLSYVYQGCPSWSCCGEPAQVLHLFIHLSIYFSIYLFIIYHSRTGFPSWSCRRTCSSTTRRRTSTSSAFRNGSFYNKNKCSDEQWMLNELTVITDGRTKLFGMVASRPKMWVYNICALL